MHLLVVFIAANDAYKNFELKGSAKNERQQLIVFAKCLLINYLNRKANKCTSEKFSILLSTLYLDGKHSQHLFTYKCSFHISRIFFMTIN